MDDLLAPFHEACKPASAFRVGAEAEKIGVLERSLTPLAYDGDHGVVRVMRELARSHGWALVEDGGPLLALEKNHASVTLEPGAQFELSGAPLQDLHAIAAEFEAHRLELEAVGKALAPEGGERIAWLGIGFHPFARQADLSWVPKPRYGVMRRYLPTRGDHGLDMMRRTATVQANFDYSSEEHAMRSVRVGLKLAPFFTALFANSPFYEGKPFGGRSFRAKVWLSVDPDRQGLLEPMLAPKARFTDYVEWALDAPMFVVIRGDEVVENTGQSFRSFMRHGFGSHRATMIDWVTHLNTLFPEVRLKRTIEVRGGDSLPKHLVVGPAALFTGLLYDEKALGEAEALTESFRFDELQELRSRVVIDGPRAQFRGRPAGEVMQRAVAIAKSALQRRGKVENGRDEATYLEPVERLAAEMRCPADDLLDHVEQSQRSSGATGTAGGASIEEAVAAASLRICRL